MAAPPRGIRAPPPRDGHRIHGRSQRPADRGSAIELRGPDGPHGRELRPAPRGGPWTDRAQRGGQNLRAQHHHEVLPPRKGAGEVRGQGDHAAQEPRDRPPGDRPDFPEYRALLRSHRAGEPDGRASHPDELRGCGVLPPLRQIQARGDPTSGEGGRHHRSAGDGGHRGIGWSGPFPMASASGWISDAPWPWSPDCSFWTSPWPA